MFEHIKEFESIPGKIRQTVRIMQEQPDAFPDGLDMKLTTDLLIRFFFDRKMDLKVLVQHENVTRTVPLNEAVKIVLEVYLLTRNGLEMLASDVIDYGLSRDFVLSETSKLTIIPHGNEAEILFEEV